MEEEIRNFRIVKTVEAYESASCCPTGVYPNQTKY